MSSTPRPESGNLARPGPAALLAAQVGRHVRQPHGLFQIAALVATSAIFVGHIRDRAALDDDSAPLTVANQDLISRLMEGVVDDPALFSDTPFAIIVFLGFLAALLVVTWNRFQSDRTVSLLVGAQLCIGLLFNNDLLLVLAAQLPIVFGTRRAFTWLLAQTAGMVCVWSAVLLAGTGDANVIPVREVIAALLMFCAWQTFAFCLGYVAMAERTNRDRLAATNAQLVAAQQLLADNARNGERLRIARELHDGLGHHLTALGLHLDLAARQLPTSHAPSVRTAREIARMLLEEVRNAVGRQREEDPIALEESLRTMCAGIPGLDVSITNEPTCRITDPAVAHVVFRCVQEALSNSMRHAGARRLWVNLGSDGEGVRVDIADDGRGSATLEAGNGLRGMHERVAAIGGHLSYQSLPGKGFKLSAWLPQKHLVVQ